MNPEKEDSLSGIYYSSLTDKTSLSSWPVSEEAASEALVHDLSNLTSELLEVIEAFYALLPGASVVSIQEAAHNVRKARSMLAGACQNLKTP